MSLIQNTGAPATFDPSRVAVQLLLNELRGAAFLWPLARDISSAVGEGRLTAVIPRSKSYDTVATPGAPTTGVTNPFGGTFNNLDRTYDRDVIVVDKFRSVADYIYDLDQDKSLVDLRQTFLTEAPASMAEYLEADITETMFQGAPTANYIRFAGTLNSVANSIITVDQLDSVAVDMSEFKIAKNDRILLASPRQARALASTSAVRDASQYGTNESILNGEVARIAGFRIVESPFLAPNRAIAFQRDAIWKAILDSASIEESREHRIKASLLSISVSYGNAVARGGNLVFPFFSEATSAAAKTAGAIANQDSLSGGNPGVTTDANNSIGSEKS